MKYVIYILMGLSILACGKADVQSNEMSLFSSWTSSEMELDLTGGQEGVFEMVIYRVYAGNPYRCFVTVNLEGTTAQVLYWYQDRAFAGAECRALVEDNDGLKTFSLDVIGQSLEISQRKADGSSTLAYTLVAK